MIDQFTCGMDFQTFRSEPMAVAAVERKLQIISEAAIRLAEDAERLCPGFCPGGISGVLETSSGMCNERIDLSTIWNTVVDDLPALRAAIEHVLKPRPADPEGSPGQQT